VDVLRCNNIGIEPGVFLVSRENNRHSVVDRGEEAIWFGGDNGATHKLRVVFAAPYVVNAGKGCIANTGILVQMRGS
jgi:hypothetical protein